MHKTVLKCYSNITFWYDYYICYLLQIAHFTFDFVYYVLLLNIPATKVMLRQSVNLKPHFSWTDLDLNS